MNKINIMLILIGVALLISAILVTVKFDYTKSGVVTQVEYTLPSIFSNPKAQIKLDDGALIYYDVSFDNWIRYTIYINGRPLKEYVGEEVVLYYSGNIYGMNTLKSIKNPGVIV